jgi:Phage Tail Collar Domain
MATGVIAMYPGAVAPDGWHLCDGSVHGSAALEAMIGSPTAPDLRDKFILGAGATLAVGAVGGLDTATLTVANLPNHDHGGGTGGQSADHTHSATSGGMSANGTHAHSGSTNTESVDHTHTFPAVNTLTQSANHTHPLVVNEGGTTDDGTYVDTAPSSDDGVRDFGNSSGHSAAHVHARPAVNSGNPNANHTHAYNSNSVSLAHTHGVVLAANTVTHTHTTTAEGTGTAFSVLPAHVVLSFVIQL